MVGSLKGHAISGKFAEMTAELLYQLDTGGGPRLQ